MHNVPYNQPSKLPIGTVAAARAFYSLDDRDPQKAREPAKALYKAYFVDDIDIGPAATVVEIAKSVGVDGAELAAALEDPAVKERVKNEVDAAIKKEVFGSPFFIIDAEPLWGVDRMPMVEGWCKASW
jgi:2-hydroxychromene-2-carboxylate isomerase